MLDSSYIHLLANWIKSIHAHNVSPITHIFRRFVNLILHFTFNNLILHFITKKPYQVASSKCLGCFYSHYLNTYTELHIYQKINKHDDFFFKMYIHTTVKQNIYQITLKRFVQSQKLKPKKILSSAITM